MIQSASIFKTVLLLCGITFLSFSQDTLTLNESGFTEVYKLLDFQVYRPITSKDVSFGINRILKKIKNDGIRNVKIGELNSDYFKNQVDVITKYVVVVEFANKFEVYTTNDIIDFDNLTKIYSDIYRENYKNIDITLITKNFGFVEVALNFYLRKDSTNSNENKICLMCFKKDMNFTNFEYANGKKVAIGIYDSNFDGKVSLGQDYFFCGKPESSYFCVDGRTMSCMEIKNNSYLFIDSANIFSLNYIAHATKKLCIKKINFIPNREEKNTISVFNKAPFELKYDSINKSGIKIKEMFTQGKYVYVHFMSLKDFTNPPNVNVIQGLSSLDNKKIIVLSLLYDDPDRIYLQNLIKKYNLNQHFGWATNEIQTQTNSNGSNRGVLFGSNGELIESYSPRELIKFCDDTFNK